MEEKIKEVSKLERKLPKVQSELAKAQVCLSLSFSQESLQYDGLFFIT
jgi:hypothetical protein